MKLYFIRHGQAEHNVTRIFSADEKNGSPLTSIGVEEVRKAAEVLAGCGITEIRSSDSLRAVQTTEIVNNKLGLDKENIVFDERLREILIGDLGGTPHDSIPEDFSDNPHKYNAEKHEDVYNRIRGVAEELEAMGKSDGNVLISGHGVANDVLMYCVCEGLDKPFDEEKFLRMYRKSIENATVSMVDMDFKKQFRKPEFVHGGERKDKDII